MRAASNVSSGAVERVTVTTERVASATATTSLMPTPTVSLGDGIGDTMAILHMLTSQRRNENMRSAQTKVGAEQELREHLEVERQEQLQAKIEAEEEGGFWDDVASVAGVVAEVAAVVGAAAATIATCGATTVALVLVVSAVALSSASMIDSHFHVLEKMGCSEDVAMGLNIGMAVGSCALTAGASLTSTGAATASKTTTAARAARNVGHVARGVGTAAQVTAGGAGIAAGSYRADARDAEANARELKHQMARSARVERMAIDACLDLDKSSRRAMESLQGAMQTHAQTCVIATVRA